jgi:hypothetical protein
MGEYLQRTLACTAVELITTEAASTFVDNIT